MIINLCAHATFPSDESHESSDESHEEDNKEYIPSLEMPLLSHQRGHSPAIIGVVPARLGPD